MVILIVEDNFIQRAGLKKIIEQNYMDVRVYDTENIKEATDIANEKEIDLFFVDIKLPDGSGIEFIKSIRLMERYKLTGVVFISTEFVQILDAFKNTHCYDFLVKPYDVADIKEIINTFINKSKVQHIEKKNYVIATLESGIDLKVYEDEILFVEYSRRKCIIYTINEVVEIRSLTLSKILNECPSLMQSHKSYLINIRYVKSIEKVYSKLWKVKFSLRDEIAMLSNSYKEEVMYRWKD
ncbi:MAG: LytR/AlgR family response regulator transcription factor [Sarcina sp.]